jgi:hypothetical protein
VITRTVTAPHPEWPQAYVANGCVGLRVGQIPLLNGAALVNGYVGAQVEERMESVEGAPYPVGCDLLVGRVWLSQRPDLAVFKEQSYDFACGELRSRFAFKIDDATAQVEVLTFCSRTQPTLTLQQVSVTVDRACNLALRAFLETAGLAGRCLRRETISASQCALPVADGCLHWESRGGLSTLGAAFWTSFHGDDQVKEKRNFWGYENSISKEYTVAAQPGRTYVLRQIGSLVPGLQTAEPDQQAMRMVDIARDWGFDELRDDNRTAWAEIWKSRVRLVGAEAKWQDIADAAYFYLHTSIHRSSPCSIAPYGLTAGYYGHVFWDAETFMFPPLLLTQPQAARAMLDYRSRMLPAARRAAALHGYAGAQFPWQSMTHGGEVTPTWCLHNFSEHHINLDVAFAFAQHAHATGDEQFLRQQAWPVLEGVADWIASRVIETARGFEIRHVVGVDEETANVNNNSYTNMVATVILREARDCARRLDITPPPAWGEIERRMFIPIDPRAKVILKHDRHRLDEHPIGMEPLVAFFPLTYRPDEEVERATTRCCLDSSRPFMHYPFIPALVGVFAARLGDRKFSAELFSSGMADFVVDPFMMFSEFGDPSARDRAPVGAPFLTAPGSFLTACLYGLTGVELGAGEPGSWCKFPVAMPALWEGVECDRIWVRGRPARLRAWHGDKQAKIEMLG